MGRSFLTAALAALASVGGALAAPQAPKAYRLKIDNVPLAPFNRTPASSEIGLYAKGERPRFKVSATVGGQPAAGETVSLAVAAPGRFPAKAVEVKLDGKGEAVYAADAPSVPGWVFVTGRIGNAKASGGAMCDKDAIRASAPPPDDFKAFWDAEIAALGKVPMKAKLTAVPTQEGLKDKVDTWEFEITCAGPRPSTGYISLPKGAKPKSLPIIVGFNGAGNIPAWRSDHYGEVAIALQVCKFGIRNGLPMKEYYRTRDYQPSVYPWVGIEDPHAAFYKWMILRNYRAMEYAKSRPEWNGELMILNGESLGGAQSLIMGALDPDVDFVSSCVPALCDHNARLAGRIQNGYPQLWKPDADGNLPEAMRKVSESARYFDAMNFCTLYRPGQEVSVGTGYTDTLCAPDGVIAAFNNIPAGVKKTLWLNPPAGHDAGNWHAGRRIFELLGKE